MSSRTAATASVVLSILLLLVFALLALVLEMVVLNGASQRQATTALSISMICHAAGAILLGVLAWKGTTWMIARFDVNRILAVTITVMLGMLAGGLISFLSVILSIPLAGIR